SILAGREAGGTWSNQDLSPPHAEASQHLHGETEYKLFGADLEQAAMEPTDNLPLSPQAGERTPYRWSEGSPPSFEPLVTPANVPAGTEFGPESGDINQVRIEGATGDLSHILLMSKRAPLVEG